MVSYPLAEAKNKTDTSPDGDPFAVCLALQRGSGFRVICPLVASVLDPDQESTFIVGKPVGPGQI
ncbi:MAG: hypothetical protein HS114_01395 [Anaerolineales bacterium]|nr:hypothetical protein [Anaerolineales bacterium]MBE7467781.1 hypothetical protein [Anaerolineales bacterium]